ncbi:MAG: DNA polymerase IV [Firmicutes bacterium]|nr:DNA polymerase IV [Bacillota bacterium]
MATKPGRHLPDRTIMHVDMDAFFAAIEQRDNPSLRGKPVVVGGRRDSVRGVVSTCSYEARRYGIHSAMPIAQAVKLCPHAIFIPTRMEVYQSVSRQIHDIFRRFSPVVEPISVDEAFIDMTGCEHFYESAEDIGRQVKAAIYQATSLTASIGIATNKFLAKLASDQQKPDGLTIVYPEEIDDFLLSLDIRQLWGVGEKTEALLRSYGIERVADLRRQSCDWLEARFGQQGRHLYQLSRGIDNRPVIADGEEAQSIGHETTFPRDLSAREDLRRAVAELAANVGWRMRRSNVFGRRITLKARYSDFTTVTRAKTLSRGINDDQSIFDTAWELFETSVTPGAFRLLGVYASSLSHRQQLSLFDQDPAADKLTETLDQINLKYGKAVIKRGIIY